MPAGPSSLGNGSTVTGPIVKPKASTSDAGVPPLIRPGGPGAAGRGPRPMIEIGGAPKTAVKPGVHTDPFAFWMDYYKKHDEAPGQLHETVRLLGASRRMRDVEATLKGYLWNRGNNAEAWMYRALAMAIHINQGSPADVKTCLNYAADLAQKSHNPNDLESVADTMMIMGHLDRVGALLDETAARVPHRDDPLKMSVNLARQTKDPARMGDTIEKLLSLGWPGEDEYVRSECRRQAEALASVLREDGRARDAAALLDRLPASMARDVYVRLTWDGYADFDLAVDEPLGVTASYDLPRTVFGGSITRFGRGASPEEVYVCPRGFDGDYRIHVRQVFADPAKPVIHLRLETIVHEGTVQEQKKVYELKPDQLDQAIVVHLSGGRRTKVMPFINPVAGRLEYQANRKVTAKHSRAERAAAAAAREAKARAAARGEAKPKS